MVHDGLTPNNPVIRTGCDLMQWNASAPHFKGLFWGFYSNSMSFLKSQNSKPSPSVTIFSKSDASASVRY